MEVEDLVKKVDALKSVLMSEIENTFRTFSDLFIQQITIKQLEEQGENGLNVKLRMPYSEQWRKTRERHGLPTDRRTLKFSGNFYKSISIEFTSDYMEIKSEGISYSNDIIGDNGVNILRPNNQFIYEMLIREVLPRVKEQMLR